MPKPQPLENEDMPQIKQVILDVAQDEAISEIKHSKAYLKTLC